MPTIFTAPIIVSCFAFAVVFWWGGWEALLLSMALATLEVSLSFDNAVVNAKVLGHMSPKWQQRFLTWGMPLAVFGVRFVLPILIVAAAAFASPVTIAVLAFNDPAQYAHLLEGASPAIHAFGGAFLLMVALKYFFDEEKSVHWFVRLERRLVGFGRVWGLEAFIALGALIFAAFASVAPVAVLVSGACGVVLYLVMELLTKTLSHDVRAGAGLALFVYLNILDAAFSLDGVVGAFALTTDILIILVGLGIGAYFVRAFTIYLTRQQTIQKFMYLEHGAHWAIFSLAVCLFAGLFFKVPQVVPGAAGLFFALLSFISSRRAIRAAASL